MKKIIIASVFVMTLFSMTGCNASETQSEGKHTKELSTFQTEVSELAKSIDKMWEDYDKTGGGMDWMMSVHEMQQQSVKARNTYDTVVKADDLTTYEESKLDKLNNKRLDLLSKSYQYKHDLQQK